MVLLNCSVVQGMADNKGQKIDHFFQQMLNSSVKYELKISDIDAYLDRTELPFDLNSLKENIQMRDEQAIVKVIVYTNSLLKVFGENKAKEKELSDFMKGLEELSKSALELVSEAKSFYEVNKGKKDWSEDDKIKMYCLDIKKKDLITATNFYKTMGLLAIISLNCPKKLII